MIELRSARRLSWNFVTAKPINPPATAPAAISFAVSPPVSRECMRPAPAPIAAPSSILPTRRDVRLSISATLLEAAFAAMNFLSGCSSACAIGVNPSVGRSVMRSAATFFFMRSLLSAVMVFFRPCRFRFRCGIRPDVLQCDGGGLAQFIGAGGDGGGEVRLRQKFVCQLLGARVVPLAGECCDLLKRFFVLALSLCGGHRVALPLLFLGSALFVGNSTIGQDLLKAADL